jgi:D-sedoheptulose 7-phosphate isomerase
MSGLGDLYPFLGDEPVDAGPVLAEVRGSTLQKSRDVSALRRALWDRHGDDLGTAAHLLAEAFAEGNKVLAFGNGGSATDAQDLVADLTAPPDQRWQPQPAMDLTQDVAMLTAVGNDVGFESVFVRQIIAHGQPGDVAVGFSTSGSSPNVVAAFAQAKRQGMRTIGFAGYDGGRMAEPGLVDSLIIAPSTYIPRIQEAHASAYHIVLCMMQALLRDEVAA